MILSDIEICENVLWNTKQAIPKRQPVKLFSWLRCWSPSGFRIYSNSMLFSEQMETSAVDESSSSDDESLSDVTTITETSVSVSWSDCTISG